MTPCLLLIAHLAVAMPALPAAGECPALPPGSGLEWTVQQGPDFDACYAHGPGETNAMFGLYLGHASSFERKPGANDEVDTIGGHAVTWQPHTGKDGDMPFGQETLFELREGDESSGVQVHAWINALTKDERDAARRVLRDISFDRRPGGN